MCYRLVFFFAKVKISRFWPKTMDYNKAFCLPLVMATYLSPCSAAAEVRMVVLIGFTSQGDNRGDAVLMASQLNQWLQLRQTQVHKYSLPPSPPFIEATVWWKVLMAFLHNRATESHEILSECSHQ